MRKERMLGRHRAVYTMAAIVLAAFIIMETRLVEAFMSLVFAGIVPGTNIVLSPDTMILVAATSIWIILGVVIIRAIIMRNRRGRHAWHQAAVKREAVVRKVGKQVVVQASTATLPAIAASAPLQPIPGSRKHRAPRKPVIRDAYNRIRITLLAAGRATGNAAQTAGTVLGRAGIALARSVARAARAAAKLIVLAAKSVVLAAKFLAAAIASFFLLIKRLLSSFWRWAEPRLWQLDEWLEIQVRRTESWVKRRIARSPRASSWVLRIRAVQQTLRSTISTITSTSKHPKPGPTPKRRKPTEL